jgi:hypothetical protein
MEGLSRAIRGAAAKVGDSDAHSPWAAEQGTAPARARSAGISLPAVSGKTGGMPFTGICG